MIRQYTMTLKEIRVLLYSQQQSMYNDAFCLRLLTHVGFFPQNGLILSEHFCIWKGARIMEKNVS